MTHSLRLIAALGLCATLAACAGPTFKPDYTLTVTFTPAALAALKAANEGVTLDAYYYGAPVDPAKANEDGQIELGQDFVAVDPAATSVHVSGAGIDQAHLNAVTGGKITVWLRAYSGTDRANLLKCAPLTAALSDLQAKPATIACDAA